MMDIAVLCRRLSDNTFVRSYLLLQTLEDVDIDVYGVVDERGIHSFFDTEKFDFHTTETETYGRWDGQSVNLNRVEHLGRQGIDALKLWRFVSRQHIDPDAIFVSSGWKGSVGAGLLSKYVSNRGTPLVIDVYDYTDWVKQIPFVNPISLADLVITSNRPLAHNLSGKTLHTPVNTERFDPAKYDRSSVLAELGIPDDKVVVGFIGTPRPEKGLNALVKAVNETDENIHGLIVGAGNGTYENELRNKAGENVTFVPPVSHSKVPQYYAALNALVLAQECSPYCEYQIPAKLFEAMSMETPVVATNIGDIPYVVGDTGFLLEEQTSTAIQNAIEDIIASDLKETQTRARTRAKEKFSKQVIGKLLERFLQDVIK